jgi:hypothetical protein
MTTKENMQLIGTEMEHVFAGLKVRVIVEDVKHSWGKRRLLVKVSGQESNSVWIER